VANHIHVMRFFLPPMLLLVTFFSALTLTWHSPVATPTSATPAPAPAPVPPPVRALRDAMQTHNVASGNRALLRVIADLADAVNRGESLDAAIQDILTRGAIPVAGQEPIRLCLLRNWRLAGEFGLLTPEILARLRSGAQPIASAGGLRGKMIITVAAISETGGSEISFRLAPNMPILPVWQLGGRSLERPRPIPAAQAAGADRDSVADFIEVGAGEAIKLERYGCGTEEVFVNAADETKGILYSTVDPAKLVVERNYDGSISRTPNTKFKSAAWTLVPIPGSEQKGALLTTYLNVSIYLVGKANFSNNRFRICIVAKSRAFKQPDVNLNILAGHPAHAAPTPFQGLSRSVEFVDLRPGEALSLARYGGGGQSLTINEVIRSQSVSYSISGPAQVEEVYFDAKKSALTQRTRDAQNQVASWADNRILDTRQKGFLLTRCSGIALYYVGECAKLKALDLPGEKPADDADALVGYPVISARPAAGIHQEPPENDVKAAQHDGKRKQRIVEVVGLEGVWIAARPIYSW
jgi:hypothetical protein